MGKVLVDSDVILDVLSDDPEWADWSESVLHMHEGPHTLCINEIIYAEVSVGFDIIEDLEDALAAGGFKMLDIPREALFLAGKAFLDYGKRGGTGTSPLPDFYIGAHATVTDMKLLTRDADRYKAYFPSVRLISPDGS